MENFRTGIGALVVKGPSFSPAPSQKSIKAAHYVFVPKRGLEEFRDWFCWFFPQLGKLSASVSRGKIFFRLHLTAVCLVMHGLEKKAANGASVQAAQNFGDLGKRVGWGEIVGRVYAVTTCLLHIHFCCSP